MDDGGRRRSATEWTTRPTDRPLAPHTEKGKTITPTLGLAHLLPMPSFGAIKSVQSRCGCDRATAKKALEDHDDDVELAVNALGENTATIAVPASLSQKSEDQKKLDDWAANEVAQSVTVTRVEDGDGETFPSVGDTLHVHYTGTLASTGSEFDSSYSRSRPFSFKIGAGQVIQGWDVGIMKMSQGEKASIFIKSDYAYGAAGCGPIPANADLRFEVHLVKIEKG